MWSAIYYRETNVGQKEHRIQRAKVSIPRKLRKPAEARLFQSIYGIGCIRLWLDFRVYRLGDKFFAFFVQYK